MYFLQSLPRLTDAIIRLVPKPFCRRPADDRTLLQRSSLTSQNFRQVFGASRTSSGNNSRRPASISKIMTSSDRLEYTE